jgi:hypothetical protein
MNSKPMEIPDLGANRTVTVSDAIVLYLKRFPGKNTEEFLAEVHDERTREAALAVIGEAHQVPMVWGTKTLIEIGQEHRAMMRQRHPELSDAAIDNLGNYFTYLVK